METTKLRLAGRVCCLALGAVCIVMAAGYIRAIRGGLEAIARCRSALESSRGLPPGYLAQLEAQAAALRAPETAEGSETAAPSPLKAEDGAAAIRDALRSQAVSVERLRTLSTGGAAATELTLSCAPVNFLRFLRSAPELPLPLSYVGIKSGAHASALDVTVRFSHEP
jgi:type II secretory pathway component PulM